jgi:hypothetical protein
VKKWEVFASNRESFEVNKENLLHHEQFLVKSALKTAGKLQRNKEARRPSIGDVFNKKKMKRSS